MLRRTLWLGGCLLIILMLAVPVWAASSTVYLPIILKAATPVPTAAPTATQGPVPTATPTLPPPTFGSCADRPNPATAPNYPVAIVAIDKVGETVTLRNVTTGDTVDLSGWQMCSVTGGQNHPIGGTLAPGQQVTYPGPASTIWNNSSRDDGALYDPAGRLVSYWVD
jgi:micrococcal nuclease